MSEMFRRLFHFISVLFHFAARADPDKACQGLACWDTGFSCWEAGFLPIHFYLFILIFLHFCVWVNEAGLNVLVRAASLGQQAKRTLME